MTTRETASSPSLPLQFPLLVLLLSDHLALAFLDALGEVLLEHFLGVGLCHFQLLEAHHHASRDPSDPGLTLQVPSGIAAFFLLARSDARAEAEQHPLLRVLVG